MLLHTFRQLSENVIDFSVIFYPFLIRKWFNFSASFKIGIMNSNIIKILFQNAIFKFPKKGV